MRAKIVALVALCVASAVQAQQQNPNNTDSVETPDSQLRLSVNGHEIRGKVLEADGKHFIAVEDLAQTTGGLISYGGGRINLAIPCDSSIAIPAGGTIKGTLTYFFDFNSRNRPDSGSRVFLVKDHVEIPADKFFKEDQENDKIGPAISPDSAPNPSYSALKKTIADGSGNFLINDVPSGTYTLVIRSGHVNNITNVRDIVGKVTFLNVQIKAGETLDKSYDFGAKGE